MINPKLHNINQQLQENNILPAANSAGAAASNERLDVFENKKPAKLDQPTMDFLRENGIFDKLQNDRKAFIEKGAAEIHPNKSAN